MFALQKKGLHVMKNVCVNQKGLRVIKMFVCSNQKMFVHQEKCLRIRKTVHASGEMLA
jgi:hypothetical protein